jgi:hypothetical protein
MLLQVVQQVKYWWLPPSDDSDELIFVDYSRIYPAYIVLLQVSHLQPFIQVYMDMIYSFSIQGLMNACCLVLLSQTSVSDQQESNFMWPAAAFVHS